MSNDSTGNLTALYRAVGKIEGMLQQFLGIQGEQSKRIGDVETRLEGHDTRLQGMEERAAKHLGWLAGASAVGGAVLLALVWVAEKFILKG